MTLFLSELSDNLISVTRDIVSIANNEHPRRIEILQMPQLCIRDSVEAGDTSLKDSLPRMVLDTTGFARKSNAMCYPTNNSAMKVDSPG